MTCMPRLLQLMRLSEVVASVGLAHQEDCDCNRCDAAKVTDATFVDVLYQKRTYRGSSL